MFSQIQVFWQLMRGQRLRYGVAVGCLLCATILNYGVPLIGSVTIDYVVGGKVIDANTPVLLAVLVQLLGGADFLRTHLWLAPVGMVALSVLSGVFSYLKGWQASLASDGIAR